MCFVTSSLVGKYIHKVTSIIWSIMMSIYHHFRLNYISKMFKTSKIMYVKRTARHKVCTSDTKDTM